MLACSSRDEPTTASATPAKSSGQDQGSTDQLIGEVSLKVSANLTGTDTRDGSVEEKKQPAASAPPIASAAATDPPGQTEQEPGIPQPSHTSVARAIAAAAVGAASAVSERVVFVLCPQRKTAGAGGED